MAEGAIGKDIQKKCQVTYPLRDCLIEKVKVLRKPKHDTAAIYKMHDLSIEFPKMPIDDKEDEEAGGDAAENAAENAENAETAEETQA